MVGADFSTPARKSVAKSKEYLTPPPDGEMVFIGEIEHGHQLPFTPKYLEMQNVTNEVMDLMWLGKRSVADTCRELDQRIDKVLERD